MADSIEGAMHETSSPPTQEHRIDGAAQLAEGERLLAVVDGREIGVFRVNGRLHAWRNRCPHQGGPVCTGDVLGRTELLLAPDRTVVRELRNDAVLHLACPWHGWEFDVETGVCAALPDRRLLRAELDERDGEVYVTL
jgi:nitrite reductase/ring-hydroxylating ferredoxin subunit